MQLTEIVLSIKPVKYVAQNACEHVPYYVPFEQEGICTINAEKCSYCKVFREEYHCFKTTKVRMPLIEFA